MTPPEVHISARQPTMHAHIPGVPPRPEEPGWRSGGTAGPAGRPRRRRTRDRSLRPGCGWTRMPTGRPSCTSGCWPSGSCWRRACLTTTRPPGSRPNCSPWTPSRKTPIRLELQNLRAELSAVLTVMGILDVLRVPVHGCVSGEISGPALGVLASCSRRSGYPNASFVLTEPKLHFGGTVTALSAREQQMTRMLDTLYFRLADVTGREVDQIRDDARQGRTLTTAQAIGYGLIQSQETSSRPTFPGDSPRPGGPPGPAGLAGPRGPRPR